MEPKKIRLVIADDHGIMRGGLCSLLSQEAGFEVLAEAQNGRQAVRLAQELIPILCCSMFPCLS
jgi:DNA-binding NarL/FixJ family response regulator